MDFTVKETMRGAAVIESGDMSKLAIDSGLKNRAFVGVDTSRLQSLPGLIVRNGEISNWTLEGITEIDGTTYFYGPLIDGTTLASAGISLETLRLLADSLHTIRERNFPVRQFSLSSVFLCSDGSLLFFPPRLMEFLNSHRLRKDSLEMIEPWNNGSAGGEAARAFTLAALAYRLVTGKIPFPGENEEEIEKLISLKSYASPLLSEPRLADEFLNLLNASFSGKGAPAQWRQLLDKWSSSGIIRSDMTDEEIKAIEEREKKKENRRLQALKRGVFFTKNRSKLLAALAAVVIIGLIVQAPLSKALAPPVTAGMSQKEVIELYYSCFKTLDTEVLDDTITAKAGKADMNEIGTIFVTSKVRTSYEGTTGIVDPEQWISEGMKPVDPGVQVWGLSDLKIRSIGNDRYEATYTKWTSSSGENVDETSPRMPEGMKIRDRIHLTTRKNAWIIDELERIKE